jgi:hypothetical protein
VRYRQGANTIALDPAVMDVFPDAEAVNEALRALVPTVFRTGPYRFFFEALIEDNLSLLLRAWDEFFAD